MKNIVTAPTRLLTRLMNTRVDPVALSDRDYYSVWLQQMGVLSDFEVAEVPGMGLGLIAARDSEPMPIGSIVARVPSELVFSAENALRHPVIGAALEAAEAEIESHLGVGWRDTTGGIDWQRACVCLLLLHERSLGEKSRFAPYLRCLPVRSTGATEWAEEDLQGRSVSAGFNSCVELREGIEKANKRLSKFYLAVVEPVLRRNPVVFPAAYYTLDAVRWAHSMVLSRALVLPGPMEGICPYLDLINHCHGERLGWSQEGAEIVVRTIKEMSPGEQVGIDYGARSGIQMMLHHGFRDLSDNSVAINTGDAMEGV